MCTARSGLRHQRRARHHRHVRSLARRGPARADGRARAAGADKPHGSKDSQGFCSPLPPDFSASLTAREVLKLIAREHVDDIELVSAQGSIRDRFFDQAFVTHSASAPQAASTGRTPTGIGSPTNPFVLGSIFATVNSS
jgi:hypothetical protein